MRKLKNPLLALAAKFSAAVTFRPPVRWLKLPPGKLCRVTLRPLKLIGLFAFWTTSEAVKVRLPPAFKLVKGASKTVLALWVDLVVKSPLVAVTVVRTGLVKDNPPLAVRLTSRPACAVKAPAVEPMVRLPVPATRMSRFAIRVRVVAWMEPPLVNRISLPAFTVRLVEPRVNPAPL